MEKEILEILKRLESKVDGIEKKLDGVVEQTADLVEFRSEILNKVDGIRDDLSTVELVTANNYKDIAKLKAVKQIDEKEKFRVHQHEISLFLFLFINTKQKRKIFNKITPYKWLKIVKKCNFAKTRFSEINNLKQKNMV